MLSLQEFVQNRYNKTIAECSNEELYLALLNYSKLASSQKPVNTGKKKVKNFSLGMKQRLQVAKNQLTLVRKKFTTSQLSS